MQLNLNPARLGHLLMRKLIFIGRISLCRLKLRHELFNLGLQNALFSLKLHLLGVKFHLKILPLRFKLVAQKFYVAALSDSNPSQKLRNVLCRIHRAQITPNSIYIEFSRPNTFAVEAIGRLSNGFVKRIASARDRRVPNPNLKFMDHCREGVTVVKVVPDQVDVIAPAKP
jgi:hypothetical protein